MGKVGENRIGVMGAMPAEVDRIYGALEGRETADRRGMRSRD